MISGMTDNDSRPPPALSRIAKLPPPVRPYTLADLFAASDTYRDACTGNRATDAALAADQLFAVTEALRATWAPPPIDKGMTRIAHVRVGFYVKLATPVHADDEVEQDHLEQTICRWVGSRLSMVEGARGFVGAPIEGSMTCEVTLSERRGDRAVRRDASHR